MDPQRLGQVVLVGRVGLVEAGDPFIERGDDLGRLVLAELDLGAACGRLFSGSLSRSSRAGTGWPSILGGFTRGRPS